MICGVIRNDFDVLIDEVNLKVLKWNIISAFSSKRTKHVKRFRDDVCWDQRLSNGRQYFDIRVLCRCIGIVVTQLQVRFDGP